MHCLWPRDPLVYGEPSEEKPAEEDRAVEGQDDRGDELPAWLDPVIDVVKPVDAVEEGASGGEAASPSDKELKGIDAVVAPPENGEVKDGKGSAVLASPEDGEGNDAKGSVVSSQDKDDACSDDCVWCQKDKGPLSGIRDIEDLDPEVYAAVQEITEMLEPSEADAQMLEPTVPAGAGADDKIDDKGGPRLVDKDWDCAASTSMDYSEEEDSTDECSCDECSCDEDEDDFDGEDGDLDEDDDSSEEYDSEDEGDEEDSSEEDDTDDEGDEEDSSEEDDTDDDGDEEDSSEEDDTEEEEDLDGDDCVCNKYYRLDDVNDRNEDDIIEAKEHLSAAEERKEEEKHEVVKGDEETASEEKEPQIDLVDPEAWFDCEDEFEDAQEDVKSVEGN